MSSRNGHSLHSTRSKAMTLLEDAIRKFSDISTRAIGEYADRMIGVHLGLSYKVQRVPGGGHAGSEKQRAPTSSGLSAFMTGRKDQYAGAPPQLKR